MKVEQSLDQWQSEAGPFVFASQVRAQIYCTGHTTSRVGTATAITSSDSGAPRRA
jgi:hypothetical protein